MPAAGVFSSGMDGVENTNEIEEDKKKMFKVCEKEENHLRENNFFFYIKSSLGCPWM